MYLVDVEHLLNNNNLYGDRSYAFIMDRKNSVDIDEAFDFKFAEILLNE